MMLFDIVHMSLQLILNIVSTMSVYLRCFYLMVKSYVQIGITGKESMYLTKVFLIFRFDKVSL